MLRLLAVPSTLSGSSTVSTHGTRYSHHWWFNICSLCFIQEQMEYNPIFETCVFTSKPATFPAIWGGVVSQILQNMANGRNSKLHFNTHSSCMMYLRSHWWSRMHTMHHTGRTPKSSRNSEETARGISWWVMLHIILSSFHQWLSANFPYLNRHCCVGIHVQSWGINVHWSECVPF